MRATKIKVKTKIQFKINKKFIALNFINNKANKMPNKISKKG